MTHEFCSIPIKRFPRLATLQPRTCPWMVVGCERVLKCLATMNQSLLSPENSLCLQRVSQGKSPKRHIHSHMTDPENLSWTCNRLATIHRIGRCVVTSLFFREYSGTESAHAMPNLDLTRDPSIPRKIVTMPHCVYTLPCLVWMCP
jgi:hypothetical protein